MVFALKAVLRRRSLNGEVELSIENYEEIVRRVRRILLSLEEYASIGPDDERERKDFLRRLPIIVSPAACIIKDSLGTPSGLVLAYAYFRHRFKGLEEPVWCIVLTIPALDFSDEALTYLLWHEALHVGLRYQAFVIGDERFLSMVSGDERLFSREEEDFVDNTLDRLESTFELRKMRYWRMRFMIEGRDVTPYWLAKGPHIDIEDLLGLIEDYIRERWHKLKEATSINFISLITPKNQSNKS